METTPANRRIRIGLEQAARYSGGQGQHAEKRTAEPAAYGFLNNSFAPKYIPAEALPKRRETVRDFFKSLTQLKKHYGIRLDDFRSLPYPYNILLAREEAGKAISKKHRQREVFIIEQDQQISLSVKEGFRRDYSLYYIPVAPVYRLWQQPEQLPTAELLTAVCGYLYAEAGISYYRDEDTYMYYNYEILTEWMDDLEGEDEEEQLLRQKCLSDAEIAGDFIQEKMMDKALRQSLPDKLNAFTPLTPYQHTAVMVAEKALGLWQTFPGANLFEHSSPIEEDEDDYGCNTTIYMHEYIGFIGSNTDAVSDTLFEMVENDFNERSYAQEPELRTVFNERQTAYTDKLAYAEKVLDLITDLCTLLYQQP